MNNLRKIKKVDQREKAFQANQQVLDRLKERPCRENIQNYREEMDQLKYMRNPYNVTMSYSNIE